MAVYFFFCASILSPEDLWTPGFTRFVASLISYVAPAARVVYSQRKEVRHPGLEILG